MQRQQHFWKSAWCLKGYFSETEALRAKAIVGGYCYESICYASLLWFCKMEPSLDFPIKSR